MIDDSSIDFMNLLSRPVSPFSCWLTVISHRNGEFKARSLGLPFSMGFKLHCQLATTLMESDEFGEPIEPGFYDYMVVYVNMGGKAFYVMKDWDETDFSVRLLSTAPQWHQMKTEYPRTRTLRYTGELKVHDAEPDYAHYGITADVLKYGLEGKPMLLVRTDLKLVK